MELNGRKWKPKIPTYQLFLILMLCRARSRMSKNPIFIFQIYHKPANPINGLRPERKANIYDIKAEVVIESRKSAGYTILAFYLGKCCYFGSVDTHACITTLIGIPIIYYKWNGKTNSHHKRCPQVPKTIIASFG